MIKDTRYDGFDALTDAQIKQIQDANNIRSDAVVVKTEIGGAVWIDPSDQVTINAYRTGLLKGDELTKFIKRSVSLIN